MSQLTPDQMKDNEEKAMKMIEAARLRAIGGRTADQVFFTACALRLQPVMTRNVPTMATDGWNMYYNPEYTLSLTPDEVHGVSIGHETLHCAMEHFIRGKYHTEKMLSNIAADLEINQICVAAGYKLPSSVCLPGVAQFSSMEKDLTFEKYYELLHNNPKKYGIDMVKLSEMGPNGDPGGCGGFMESPDQAKESATKRRWEEAIAGAAQEVASRKGSLSAGLQRIVDAVIKPKYDPWSRLEQYLVRAAKNDISWTRCDRRSLARRMYMPSHHSLELGEVCIMFDLSGSITDEQARMMGWVLESCLERTPGKLTILYHDVEVHRVREWQPGQGPIGFEPCGGGGTSHRPAFKKIQELGLEPDLILAVTDMETDFPESCPWSTVWLNTVNNGIEPPFGERISLV